MIPELMVGKNWRVVIEDDRGKFKAILGRRTYHPEWFLIGSGNGSYGCARFIPWASGGLYWDDELFVKNYRGPTEFALEIVAELSPEFNFTEIPIDGKFAVRFQGVSWKEIRHTGIDSICSGSGSFDCEKFSVEPMAEDVDQPIVLARIEP